MSAHQEIRNMLKEDRERANASKRRTTPNAYASKVVDSLPYGKKAWTEADFDEFLSQVHMSNKIVAENLLKLRPIRSIVNIEIVRSAGFIRFAFDLLLPSDVADDAYLTLDDLYHERWHRRHGSKKAKIILCVQASQVVWNFYKAGIIRTVLAAVAASGFKRWLS